MFNENENWNTLSIFYAKFYSLSVIHITHEVDKKFLEFKLFRHVYCRTEKHEIHNTLLSLPVSCKMY